MSAACFHQPATLERLRTISVTCLVFDSLFTLLYSQTAVTHAVYNHDQVVHCESGDPSYTKSDVLVGTAVISALTAAAGMMVHGQLACNKHNNAHHLVSVSRFAHVLVCWTFIKVLLETFAYPQTEHDCVRVSRTSDGDYPGMDNEREVSGILQVAHAVITLLWLAWITSVVRAAVMSRRCIPLLETEPGSPRQDPTAPCADPTPHVVGVTMAESAGVVVARGTPAVEGNATFGPDAAAVAQGGVAQGMPVAGSSASSKV